MCDAAPAVSKPRPEFIHRSNYCAFCERTPSGRIRRSSSARRAFQELNPCPATGATAGPCPGYEIDHITPLHLGGADAPGNMQWLTHEQHVRKTASGR
jgi:hypothetical protein